MKKVAVLQSNYIPWKGYFDIIHDVDLFIFHDDLQYTKNDWRNRNKIMTADGLKWLTIPVGTDEHRLICEVKIPNRECLKKHYQILKMAYGKCPYFPADPRDELEEYSGSGCGSLDAALPAGSGDRLSPADLSAVVSCAP